MALRSFSYLTGSLDDTAFLDLTDRNLPRQKTLPKFCNMTKKVNYICNRGTVYRVYVCWQAKRATLWPKIKGEGRGLGARNPPKPFELGLTNNYISKKQYNTHLKGDWSTIYIISFEKQHVATQLVSQVGQSSVSQQYSMLLAQGKGRAKGRPRKVTQRYLIYRWWMVDGVLSFPWCFTLNLVATRHPPPPPDV